MGRPLRIRFYEPNTIIHVMSKTAGGAFLLESDVVKMRFLIILKGLLGAFSFKLVGFTIMDNHFHLLLEAEDINDLRDEEVLERVGEAGIYKRLFLLKDVLSLRRRLSDLSEFMKNLKERFSKWFNREFDRYGYFWGGRYKSVVVEGGDAFRICKGYIEMNPVNAGIVGSPEEYKFSSCGEMGEFMGIEGDGVVEVDECLMGGEISQLEDGLAFGSLDFIGRFHDRFVDKLKLKRLRNYKPFTKRKSFFSFINTRG